MDKSKNRVLIAGIGGASLGTEILKCLNLSGKYDVFGCDISKLVYGHYLDDFKDTFIVDRNMYAKSVLELCKKIDINFIIPGGGESMVLLSEAEEEINIAGIKLATNSHDIIEKYSDKEKTFETLSSLGISIPTTKVITTVDEMKKLKSLKFPLVIKPSCGSGGSNFVFLSADKEEAHLYINHLLKNDRTAIVQEYIPIDEGEFTIGVVSIPGGEVVCSIAMKREFSSKLSLSARSKAGLISSGYTQGLIDDFYDIRMQSENIAKTIHSEGPINIQGRVRGGVLIPFEINPRFSASCYMRALSGINEVDIFLQYLSSGAYDEQYLSQKGYYLRSFSEIFIKKENIKK